jgi:disulfide bond formation protein DsbB
MSVLQFLRARRRANAVLLAACIAMLAYALFLQYYRGLEPCPLCMFQRFAVVGLAVVFALALLVADEWRVARRIIALLTGLIAVTGAGIAIRHLYIQSLPPGQVPSCGATLDYMLDIFPLSEVIRKVLTGSGECAKIDWTFLGLSMPGWVLIVMLTLGTVGIAANWPARRA